MTSTRFRPMGLALASIAVLCGCTKPDPNRVQGYVEGEFVYVASPYAGALEKLSVYRGTRVHAGDALFTLDCQPEKSARDEAERRVIQARSNLEDLKKGRRPTEIESLVAQLGQARAALVRSEKEFARDESLVSAGSISADDLDRARANRDQDRQRVAQLEADLDTAKLGSREDQIAAAAANLRALEATLAKAEWDLRQKSQFAAEPALVFDTLYREGEWVAAGKPAVILLPPRNVLVRAFVPETRVGAIKLGDQVRVEIDGVAELITGRVRYISPRAEFTPPVIYSRESRGKLVFMIEIVFDPEVAAMLHPGQPVDVHLQ